jgi:hypothetical protein
LALHDELTSAEVSAGFRIAEIYGAFEFFHGRTRSAGRPAGRECGTGEADRHAQNL